MKYIGSKQKISKYIIPIIQKYIDDNNIIMYIEPFVGGANIIDKIKCCNRFGFDIDNLVINLYKNTVHYPEKLNSLPDFISKDYYYEVRDNIEKYPDWYRSAILLFASYNSRVYGGCYGGYAKTKNGNIRNYYNEALNNYKKQIPKLANIHFQQQDYKDLNSNNCVIYCDPPYKNRIGYCKNFNHNEFWQWVRNQSKNNIVIVSEYEAPNDFECIWEKEIKTHLNNRNKINKTEKLFVFKNRMPQGKGE